jgi:hypothetical protein
MINIKMDTLRCKINDREAYITMLMMFKNIFPKEIIENIFSFVKDQSHIISGNFKKGIKEILGKKYKFTKGAYHILNMLISTFITKIVESSTDILMYTAHNTLTGREILTAIKICYKNKNNSKLVNSMVSNGMNSYTSYNAFNTIEYHHKRKTDLRVEGKLKLYPKHVEHVIRKSTTKYKENIIIRVGIGTTIYLTGVVDVMVDEIIMGLDKYGNLINMDDIINTCKNNIALKLLFSEVFI